MSTIFWVLSFVYFSGGGLHNVLAVSDANGVPFTSQADCAASAQHVAAKMNLAPKEWRYQCHELDVVADKTDNTIFVKFPEY